MAAEVPAAPAVTGRTDMLYRALLTAIALVALPLSNASAEVLDYAKYPNLKGQWNRFIVRGVAGQPSFDQTKSGGLAQKAPLTPEYQAILEASVADQATGGLGDSELHSRCSAAGMPWMMVAFRPLEFVISPETTYILIADFDALRRIFTDGRDWPETIEPTFQGYSIGRWIDEDGDGRYDVLQVETRAFKGPRLYDVTGLPLHRDNQSIFKERIFLDKADANVLHDEITVIDNALTRPWVVDKRYVRNADPRSEWPESVCAEYNAWVFIEKQPYYLSSDGYLMPAKKDQGPPDLKYFKKARK